MITLITGKKGSGKTKKLIESVDAALQTSKGHVAVIAQGDTLKFDIKHTARLMNTDDYKISGFDAFYGFLAGLAAGNFDITDIFVDGILRIAGRDYERLGEFFDKVNLLESDIHFTFTVSADTLDLPDSVKKFI